MQTTIEVWAPSTRHTKVSVEDNRVWVWLTSEGEDLTVTIEDEPDELLRWLADTYDRVARQKAAEERARPQLLGFPCEGSAMPDRRGDAA